MPLNLEVFKPFEAKWVNAAQILPGNHTSPTKNINSNGEKESIILDCSEDDSNSAIFKFLGTSAKDVPSVIRDHLYERLEVIVLERGESHIIELHKTIGGTTKLIKVSHI